MKKNKPRSYGNRTTHTKWQIETRRKSPELRQAERLRVHKQFRKHVVDDRPWKTVGEPYDKRADAEHVRYQMAVANPAFEFRLKDSVSKYA